MGAEFTINGIPRAISRAALAEVVKSLGIDPDYLRAIEFSIQGIRAEVYARNAEGRFLGGAVHTIYIEAVDE